MWDFRKAGCLLALLVLCVALPASAGVPKVVVAEDFTATWCTYCPFSDCALHTLLAQYPETFIVLEEHCSPQDPFTIPEVTAREQMYGVGGYPTVRFDGKYAVVGAGSCNTAYSAYLSRYNQRISETGGVSPVSIEGSFGDDGVSGTVQATLTLLDPATLGSVQATLFIYEDDIYWCCGYGGQSTWEEVVRVVQNAPVTLVNVGDQVTINKSYTVGAGWNTDNLHAVVILQETGGQRTVIQSARLTHISDFAVSIPKPVRSVPQMNGTALFDGTIQNLGNSNDVVTLSVDQAMGWPTDFQIQGDPNWYTTTPVTLGVGEIKGITVRVQTDGNKRIGTGTLSGTSANSGRTRNTTLRVFNGSKSVLMVDDDYNGNFEAPYLTALNDLGYLYEDWDSYFGHGGASPGPTDLAGFDAVIWQTGYRQTDLVTPNDVIALKSYLDLGGTLYLNSMDLLSTTVPADFLTDYLGVATYVNNTKGHTETGVAGDPITDGIVLPLFFAGGEGSNRIDTVNPTANANTIFFSEIPTSNAIRNVLSSSGRVVFSTIPQDAISQSNPAPNNSETVIQRILNWLLLVDPASAPEAPAAAITSFGEAQPNPLHQSTELTFRLSDRAGSSPVRLTLVDAAGRQVRNLVDGKLGTGLHHATWDGRDDSGRQVGSGVYFALLKSEDGQARAKLVLTR